MKLRGRRFPLHPAPLASACAAAALSILAQPAAASDLEAQTRYDALADARRAALRAREEERFAAARAWAAEDPQTRFAAPCVRADAKAREVSVDAFTTDLAPGGISEFALITLNSGHEYEALFQTAATAADVEKALQFAGMAPGRPASPLAFRYWPRGERVFARVSVGGAPERPLEDFFAHADTGGTFAPEGFVHCGGIPSEGGSNQVDFAGPGSMVSTYNEPFTLFDVPRLAPQSDVYETIVASTNFTADPWTAAEIVFRPEKRPAPLPPLRVRDVALRLLPDGRFAGVSPDGEAVSPAELVAALRSMREKDAIDPFVSFSWAPECTFSRIRAAAQLLALLGEPDAGVRIDAPPDGFPFFRAFLPREEWRDRANRYTQPCEVRFAADGPATFVAVSETWSGEKLKPDLEAREIPLPSPEALPALLAEHSPPGEKAVLFFVPASAPWSAVAPFAAASAPSHPLLQVFVQ